MEDYKIKVEDNITGEVVRTLSYATERQQEKGFMGLIRNMNLDDYTATMIGPEK